MAPAPKPEEKQRRIEGAWDSKRGTWFPLHQRQRILRWLPRGWLSCDQKHQNVLLLMENVFRFVQAGGGKGGFGTSGATACVWSGRPLSRLALIGKETVFCQGARLPFQPELESLMRVDNPFPLPANLTGNLARAHDYWKGLIRGNNDMPFWDDFKPSALADFSEQQLLVDVFDHPQRFRFSSVGADFVAGGKSLLGLFSDELRFTGNLSFFNSQCFAAVEGAEATCFAGVSADSSFERLVLPMWGDGRIGMLLGVVERR
jgi:hypothetical protein